MKLTKLFATAAIVLAMFASCKKDETVFAPAPAANNGKLLMKWVEASATYTYEYNADRTAKSYSWSNGYYKMEFAYQPNKLILTLYGNNVKIGYSVYELINGITQKYTGTNYDANGNPTDIFISDYIYNAKGLMEKCITAKNGINTGYELYSYYANNDLAKYESYDKNGILTFKSEYEYDLSLLAKWGAFGQFNTNGTDSVFPKKTAHLLKKVTQTYNGVVSLYTYTNTLDTDGYTLTTTVKDNSNGTTDTQIFTWQ